MHGPDLTDWLSDTHSFGGSIILGRPAHLVDSAVGGDSLVGPGAASLTLESRARLLAMMLSSIADLTYAFDRRGALLYANKPAFRWGIGMEEAAGKTVADLGYPEALARRIQAHVAHIFATRQSISGEMCFRDRDGVDRFYEYTLTPALGSDGEIEFGIGFSRDISERKLAHNVLRASVTRFHILAAAMPQIVWTTSTQGKLTSLSRQWTDYTGTTAGPTLGRRWCDVLQEHGADIDRERCDQIIAKGRTFAREICLRGKNGQLRWWLMRGVPMVDEQGAVVEWVGTCTDIDELKLAQVEVSRANAELQRQRTELRVLFDHVPAMIWFKDTDNNFLHANERAARSIGRSAGEIVGRSAYELYPAQAHEFAATDLQVITTGQPLLGKLELGRDEAGNERWIQKDKVPYHDEHGDVIGVVVMSHDITDRKRDQDALRELNAELETKVRKRTEQLAAARDEAERANQAKSSFLATMSHEIRTPMSGMLGLLELLEVSGLNEEQLSTLRVARESGQALQRIIDDLLDFSKIEANSLELDLAPASIRQVVEGACRLHGQAAAAKGLALGCTFAPDTSPALMLDRLRLGQVLNNFLSNAIKFTAQGQVSVSVEVLSRTQDHQRLRISVRDTGIGIDPGRQSLLFQPFSQAGATTSTRFGGTGLGLFISRRLGELMGGEVELQSRPGEGTVVTLSAEFAICDPAALAQDAGAHCLHGLDAYLAGRPRAPTTEQAQRDRTLLLVVDDHPVNRAVLARQVMALGYAVEEAGAAEDAVTAWQTGRFAAVITDCNMPGMNGFELSRRLRAIEASRGLPRAPIIGCTADALPSALAACMDSGMDDVMTKPVDLRTMGRVLDRWVPLPTAVTKRRTPVPAAAPPSVPARDGLLDMAMLHAISGGDAEAEMKMVRDYRRTLQVDAGRLRRFAHSWTLDKLVGDAHRLGGACSMMGSTRLAQACLDLQDAAVRNEREAVARAFAAVEDELLRLRAHLDDLLSSRSAIQDRSGPPASAPVAAWSR